MLSVDRGFGQFSAEIRSASHWYPVFMLRVGKGTARVDVATYIHDGTNARRFPRCYATSPDGTPWSFDPGAGEEAATAAARASLEREAKAQLATVRDNIHELIEAIERACAKKSPLVLVRKSLGRGGSIFEPRERPATTGSACLRRFDARSSEAYRTGWALVAAQPQEDCGSLAYAKIKPGDLLVMRKFLELTLAFRDMEQPGGA
jgi:hypothetical protein